MEFQKARELGDLADKVDDVIGDLLLAIQNIGVIGDSSIVHLDEVRIAAIYLSAAVMDCLTSLINWVNGSSIFLSIVTLILVLKNVFLTPHFDESVAIVHTRSALYTSALQSKFIREKQQNDVLEWICPSSTKYIRPKSDKEVGNTCRRFVESREYLDWVGEEPWTLICSGKGT